MSTAAQEMTLPIEGPSLATLVLLIVAGFLVFDVLRLGSDFSRTYRWVGRVKTSRRVASADIVDRVCRSVNLASALYPKQVRCVQRSAVTTCLLRCYGVPAQMVVGAQTVPFKAHAWTEVNDRAVNERNDVQNIYSVWERC